MFDSYVPQILSKLTKDGVAFIHHSNFSASGSLKKNIHIRSQNVDSEKIADLIGRFGGSVVVQERINWRGGPELIDCLTTFSTQRAQSPIKLDNPLFMAEAQIIKNFHSPYG